MLRDWTRSEKIVDLTVHAERFFVRLIMKADDYGCYYAKPALLKADLFPLLDTIRETDLLRWLAECQKAGLIVLYEVESKAYVQIIDFKQRLDKAKNRFPLPTSIDSLAVVTEIPGENEVENEVEEEKRKRAAQAPTPSPSFKKLTEPEFYQQIGLHKERYPKEMLRAFFEYWKEPSATGIMRFQLEKTWETGLRLKTWQKRDKTFSKKERLPDNGGAAPLKQMAY